MANLLHLTWTMTLYAAREDRKLSGVAELLRDPSVPMTQADREALAELLVPQRRGAKVRAKLQGRGGRGGKGGTATRDLAFYEALEAHRMETGTDRIPAEVKEQIAARYGLLNAETIKSAETRGKALHDAEREARSD